MKLESNTLFMKIFFLVALAVITSNLVWFLLLHTLSAEPKAKAIAQIAVSAVNLVRTSLYAAAPERREYLLNEFSRSEGIFLHPDNDITDKQKILIANHRGNHQDVGDGDALLRLVQREIQKKLGENTRIAVGINGNENLWISFKFNQNDKDEYWLELPRYMQNQNLSYLLLWGILTTLIIIALSWRLASNISLPLKRLAEITVAFGKKNTQSSADKNLNNCLSHWQEQDHEQENSSKEIQALTSAFFNMMNDLNANEKEREIVLAGISHDLRTPLTRLRLEVEMSLYDNPESQQGMICDIELIESIIKQFMDYARTNNGEEFQNCNPQEIFEEIIQNEVLHNRELKTDIGKNFSPMNLRKIALSRAISNLINNAWKYGKPPIELHAFVDDKANLIIEIIDHGNGVKPELLEDLKRPFARGEAARTNVTGTGLGLAIVERIAKLHNGKFELESGQQEQFNGKFGLLARITLPIENTQE